MAERTFRGVAALFVGMLLATPGLGCARGRTSDDAARARVKAHVVSVMSRKVQRNVEAVGSLFPFEEVTVSSEVDGRVDGVYVDVGDPVGRGQPLVKILPVELSLTLDEQQAALRQIEARLAPPEGGGAPGKRGDAAEVKKAEADRDRRPAEVPAGEGALRRGPHRSRHLRRGRGALQRGPGRLRHGACRTCRTSRAQAAQRTASVALADKKLERHRDPRALRRPGEAAHGEPRAVREGADAGHGGRGHRSRARAAQGPREDGGLGGGGPAGDRSGSRPTPDRVLRGEDLAHEPVGRAGDPHPSRSRPCSPTRTGG